MALFAFIFLIGICFGSFITMASHRLPRNQDIVHHRSHCPLCHTPLRVIDLIPVLSWMYARGKCRYCGAPISRRYWLIEAMTGITFVLLYWRYDVGVELVIFCLFYSALFTMIVADIETKLIPDEIHYFLFPLGIAYHYWLGTPITPIATTIALAAGVGLLLHYGYYWLRGYHGLGFGDVKFLLVIGLWLGSPAALVPFFFFSGIGGIVTGLIWQYCVQEKRFPFAPALAASLALLVTYPTSRNWLAIALEQTIQAALS